MSIAPSPRWTARLSWIAPALFTLLVHAPTVRLGYVYDDVEAILENPRLRTASSAPGLFLTNYWGDRNIGLYRPVVQLTYLLEGCTFGFHAAISHGINALLHALVVALLSLWLQRLDASPLAAAVASALFGVHPALVDASVWISGRTDVLATGFSLAAMLLAERAAAEQQAWRAPIRIASAGVWALALFSKEMAITVPILLALRHGWGFRRTIPTYAAALVLYLSFRALAVDGFLPGGDGDDSGRVLAHRDSLDAVALASRALFRLLAMLIVPVGLSADHRAHPLADPAAPVGLSGGLALLGWIAVFVAGLIATRRWPRAGFLLAATPVTLLPVLQIVKIGAVMAERFLYQPAICVLPLVVLGVRSLLRISPVSEGARRTLVLGLSVAALAALTSSTLGRFSVYRDRGAYCEDVLRVYPADARAWNNLGVYHGFEAASLDGARADRAFAEALTLRPGYRRAALNRVRNRLDWHGRSAEGSVLTGVEGWLARFIARGDAEALYLLGKIFLRRGGEGSDASERDLLARACSVYREASVAFDRSGDRSKAASAWKECGLAASRLGDRAAMAHAYEQALARNPDVRDADALRRAISRPR